MKVFIAKFQNLKSTISVFMIIKCLYVLEF